MAGCGGEISGGGVGMSGPGVGIDGSGNGGGDGQLSGSFGGGGSVGTLIARMAIQRSKSTLRAWRNLQLAAIV